MIEQVSVVIPVYGQWNLVKRNIDALIKFDAEYLREILVIDDCSPQPNPYIFDRALVKVIPNQTNLGYSGTVNKGLKEAVSSIIVLLDSDAYPVGPFIRQLGFLFSSDMSIGCIGFSTVDEQGTMTGNYQFESNIAGLIMGQALEARLKISSYKKKKNILPHSCAVSFKKQCLVEMNYLDEIHFPVLDADVDLSMRIHRSRWKLVFTRDITICHKGGSSYQVNYKRVLLHHKSRWALLKKFDLIPLPALMKALIRVRVRTELAILRLCTFIRKDAVFYEEKIKGRRILLKDIDAYT